MDASSTWIPSLFCENMEYKVLNIFFCEQYHLPFSVFDFPAYIREVLDHNILSLIEVDVSSWIALCIVLCANVIRSEFNNAAYEDSYSPASAGTDDGHRRMAGRSPLHRLLGEDAVEEEHDDECPAAEADPCAAAVLDGSHSELCTSAGNGHECEYTAADASHVEACSATAGRRSLFPSVFARESPYTTLSPLRSSYAENSTHFYLRVLGAEPAADDASCSSCDAQRRLGAEVYRFLGETAAADPADTCGVCELTRRLGGTTDDAATAAVCACITDAHRRLGGGVVYCEPGTTEAAHRTLLADAPFGFGRLLGGAEPACVDPCAPAKSDGIIGFIASGWVLLAVIMFLAYLGRRAERRLFRLIGLNSWAEQAQYIEKSVLALGQAEEDMLNEQISIEEEKHNSLAKEQNINTEEREVMAKDRQLVRRQSRSSFDRGIMLKKMKEQHSDQDDHGHSGGHDPLSGDAGLDAVKGVAKSLGGAVGLPGVFKVGSKIATQGSKLLRRGSESPGLGNKYLTTSSNTTPQDTPTPCSPGNLCSGKIHPEGNDADASPPPSPLTHGSVLGSPTVEAGHDRFAADEKALKDAENEMAKEEDMAEVAAAGGHGHKKKKRGIDLSTVYLFNSPLLFNKTLDICLLLNCFYLAIFFSNYCVVALNYGGGRGFILFFLAFIPALVFYPFVIIVTRTSSVLSAIATLDANIVGHVIAETEDMLNIQHEVFDTFRAKMKGMGLTSIDLKELFSEIDADGSGEVDSRELHNGLAVLGMHFSSTKFKRLFRAVDKDRSGAICFEEFYTLVYPDERSSESKAKE